MQQIGGILLLSLSLIFSAVISASSVDQSFRGQAANQLTQNDKRQVLGVQQERFDALADKKQSGKNNLFPTELYFGRGDQTANELIQQENILIYPEDRVDIFPDSRLKIGFILKITRALPVVLVDGGKKKIVRTFKTRVGDFLAEQKIKLGDQDKLNYRIDDPLTKDMLIEVVRVDETRLTLYQPVPFKTRYQDDATLEKGKTRLIRAGKKGKRELVYLVRRENGQEVSRRLLTKKLVQPAQDKLVRRGTKEVVYGSGVASWFGAPRLTAAHNHLPRGTFVRVTNLKNGKNVVVKIIGGGIKTRAIIDLSPDAFQQLAPLSAGIIQVKLTKP